MRYSVLWAFLAAFQFGTATGCSKDDPQAYLPPPMADSSTKSFLALGDSYTIGESVAAEERFPAQTRALLNRAGSNIGAPLYIARTGWTTADLQTAIDQSKLTNAYDIVTLLIGVNDQYQGMDTAGYRTRFKRILQNAVVLAGNKTDHVFVLSIPDYGVTPFGGGSAKISKEIDAFNAINKQVTASYNIAYIDITPISKQAATDQSLTANDGLHPSGKQYAMWAKLLAAFIKP